MAFFAYRYDTLWDYVLRDGLFFFAFLGFIPLALAANVATGGRRAAVQIAAAFIAVGAIFGALNAVDVLRRRQLVARHGLGAGATGADGRDRTRDGDDG